MMDPQLYQVLYLNNKYLYFVTVNLGVFNLLAQWFSRFQHLLCLWQLGCLCQPKMLEQFIKLGSPRFTNVVGDNTNKSLVCWQERFHNMCLVECHGVHYTSFRIDGLVKKYQRFISLLTNQDTANELGQALLEKYVPHILKERLWDEFTNLTQDRCQFRHGFKSFLSCEL